MPHHGAEAEVCGEGGRPRGPRGGGNGHGGRFPGERASEGARPQPQQRHHRAPARPRFPHTPRVTRSGRSRGGRQGASAGGPRPTRRPP
eukprot:672339-Pyramimonas_sp.AAC.1